MCTVPRTTAGAGGGWCGERRAAEDAERPINSENREFRDEPAT
jgi:hypothetical protein